MTDTATAAPAAPALLVSDEDGVRTLTLNRPDVFNALDDGLTKALQDALKAAAKDHSVRVLVLTGQGRAFCSGQDLGELKERYVPGYVPELRRDLERRYNPIVTMLARSEKPIVCAVNGVAAGAGCSLAIACDFRVASEHASFAEVFVDVGLVPDSGSTWFLPRLVGHAKALELCLTGRRVKAEEALAMGLVDRVVAADELATTAQALGATIAAKPPRAIALTRRLLSRTWDRDLAGQLDAEAFAQDTAGRTADHTEGVTAFLEKRAPEFTGR